MSEERVKQLEARVKELEDAIGVCVPALIRVLLQVLPESAELDRSIAKEVLNRVDKAMEYGKLLNE